MATDSTQFARDNYKSKPSTLCKGCGHDAVTNHIISALHQNGVDPTQFIKVSGIGCSSKTPAYFGRHAFSFNGVHGRMPALATGAKSVNKGLTVIGLSGDGDTASIGMGQFCHCMRRNMDMVYIMENNGVYGLTKGQFSATADLGSTLKTGMVNEYEPIDLCAVAINMGAPFVARTFSGDKAQVVPLLQAALSFNGTAFLDILSPCVTFNNHEGSTKSYAYIKEHDIHLQEVGYLPENSQIVAEYDEGTIKEVKLHDGSILTLKKVDKEYNPNDKKAAFQAMEEANEQGQILTGLIYFRDDLRSLTDQLNLTDEPIATLPEKETKPGPEILDEIMKSYM